MREIKMFEGLKLIGGVTKTIGSHFSDGIVHEEEFEVIPEKNISGMIHVSYKICKFGQYAGSMLWSKSSSGSLSLVKKKRGTNSFGILSLDDNRYVILEKDRVQQVGIINIPTADSLIWAAEIMSPQRPVEQVHELLLYSAFLLQNGLRV